MRGCEALEEFPFEICTLKALQGVSIYECKSLRKILEGLGGWLIWRNHTCWIVSPGRVSLQNMQSQGFGGSVIWNIWIFGENTIRFGELSCLEKLDMWDCEALKVFLSEYSLSRLWRNYHSWMQVFTEHTKRFGGIELLEEIGYGGLRGLGGVSFQNMHS